MKRAVIVGLCIGLLLSCGCAGRENRGNEAAEIPAAEEASEQGKTPAAEVPAKQGWALPADEITGGSMLQEQQTMRVFEILEVSEDSLLVCGVKDEAGLFCVSLEGEPENVKGEAAAADELAPGMLAELYWDGSVMESYPGQFSVSRLRLTADPVRNQFSFYLMLLKELAGKASNEGITNSYFDFTAAASLSEGEKEGLAYLAGSYFGGWGSQAVKEELLDSSEKEDRPEPEDSVWVRLEEISAGPDSLQCNAERFRADQGGYGLLDVKGRFRQGRWHYEIGSEFISCVKSKPQEDEAE